MADASSAEKEKLVITACKVDDNGKVSVDSSQQFKFTINPEKYDHSFAINYSDKSAIGQSAANTKFSGVEPQTLKISTMIDTTGAIGDAEAHLDGTIGARRQPLGAHHDLAVLGELDGVADEVEQDLTQSDRIAEHLPGQPGIDEGHDAPLRSAAGARVDAAPSTTCAGDMPMRSRSSFPASIFEKSRMSLMIVKSA